MLGLASLTLGACFAGASADMAPGAMEPPSPMAAEPPPADGTWESAPGEPRLVLTVQGDALVLVRELSAGPVTATLARVAEGRYAPDGLGVTADTVTSCVEIVSVEADALVVRVGTMENGQCVLSADPVRLARQVQRP